MPEFTGMAIIAFSALFASLYLLGRRSREADGEVGSALQKYYSIENPPRGYRPALNTAIPQNFFPETQYKMK